MGNMRKMVLLNILVLFVLVGGGAAAYYSFIQSTSYVQTDNAMVDGQLVSITSPAMGKLVGWHGEVGKTFEAGEVVGSIQPVSGSGSSLTAQAGAKGSLPSISLNFPMRATIVQQNAVENSLVTPGTPLAQAYDLDNLWVSANVDETDLPDLAVGQEVDVYVDAYPGTTLRGRIEQIGLATAGSFSLLPRTNTTANYTKVTQVIPVRITLGGYEGLHLVPGMNSSVRIHL